jgi:hypothetical protein
VIMGHQGSVIHSCMKNYGCFSWEPRLVKNSTKIEQSQVSVLPVYEINCCSFNSLGCTSSMNTIILTPFNVGYLCVVIQMG